MSVPASQSDEARRLEMVVRHPHAEDTLGMVLGLDSTARSIYVVAIKPGSPLHTAPPPQRAHSPWDHLLRAPALCMS